MPQTTIPFFRGTLRELLSLRLRPLCLAWFASVLLTAKTVLVIQIYQHPERDSLSRSFTFFRWSCSARRAFPRAGVCLGHLSAALDAKLMERASHKSGGELPRVAGISSDSFDWS